ncbi:unnamed protein product [Durusdinium trenchii]|uniref:PH domain-containing protein n=1 Tax=Durusdinium trenchii TaxID=1381693 RepID=A0ABP0M723_9DINO
MMSVVCTILPEDPYEYMMNHVVSRRPAPPPSETELCGSGALWVLLKEGDPLNPEHWRLRRCWLTSSGTFCLSTEPATVTKHGAMLKMTVGGSFRELDEDEAVRPFAFALSTGGKQVCLAAGSEEQRDEWFNLLGHFADADRRKGPLPKSAAILSPRTSGGGTQVVDAISAADVPIVIQTKKAIEEEKTLKPILKTKPSQPSSSPVPAIRIPRRMPADPMEASGLTSTRRSSIRFSDEVEKREFAVQRADPVPQNLRAHESRRKPQIGAVPVAEPEVPERPEQPANREEQDCAAQQVLVCATC